MNERNRVNHIPSWAVPAPYLPPAHPSAARPSARPPQAGMTPFMLAVSLGRLGLMGKLLDIGANVNAKCMHVRPPSFKMLQAHAKPPTDSLPSPPHPSPRRVSHAHTRTQAASALPHTPLPPHGTMGCFRPATAVVACRERPPCTVQRISTSLTWPRSSWRRARMSRPRVRCTVNRRYSHVVAATILCVYTGFLL